MNEITDAGRINLAERHRHTGHTLADCLKDSLPHVCTSECDPRNCPASHRADFGWWSL